MDVEEVKNRFFVRVKGSMTGDISKVEEVFGNVQPYGVADVADEFGFLTEEMTEKEFREKAARVEGVISRIRARV